MANTQAAEETRGELDAEQRDASFYAGKGAAGLYNLAKFAAQVVPVPGAEQALGAVDQIVEQRDKVNSNNEEEDVVKNSVIVLKVCGLG